jgi:hypothetical protein
MGGVCSIREGDDFLLLLTMVYLTSVDWIEMAQDRFQWRALVTTVMKLQVP